MAKSTVTYDQDDVALAALNKIMASPDCVVIIDYLRTQDSWTEISRLEQLPLDRNQIKKYLRSLKTTKVVNTVNQQGVTFYQLNLAYFKLLPLQFSTLVYQMAEHRPSSNL